MLLDNDATPEAPADFAADPELENILAGIAEELGVLMPQEEFDALKKAGLFTDEPAEAAPAADAAPAEGSEPVTEAAKNIVRLNRGAKLSSLEVRSALVLAQRANDPLFRKYALYAKLKRDFRAKIFQKYSGKARTTARTLLANAGKRKMVDVSSTKAFGNPASTS